MPIKPENKARYPANWKQIREQILLRAGNCCEGSPDFPECRRPNHALINKRTEEVKLDGWDAEAWELADGDPVVKVVLTIAHLDHVPENCDPTNLRAWCQRCHLNYDRHHHATNSYMTRKSKAQTIELFQPRTNHDAH